MISHKNTQVFIRNCGAYLPDRVVKNVEFTKWMDTSDEWIVQRSGIKERRWASKEQATSDLALAASERALSKSNLKAGDLDLIITATLSPDIYFPGVGVILADKLGAGTIPAMDIRCQCSGFLYSLAVAEAFIRTGAYKRILVAAAEIQSKALNLSTAGRDTAVLFGDGAGAVIVEGRDESLSSPGNSGDILGFELHAEGAYADKLAMIYPSMREPHLFHNDLLKADDIYPKMEGRTVFKNAVTRLPEVVLSLLKKQNTDIQTIDHFFFHQANLRINEAAAKLLEIDPDKIWTNIDRVGNCSGASIPICMTEAEEAGKLKRGDLCCLAAFGAGFTWGALLLRW